jgi:HD-like signal output (HDOD) protein
VDTTRTIRLQTVLAGDLPGLPAATLHALHIARQPEPDLKELARVIKSDPALTARMLKTANSSLFGLRLRVLAIEQAVPLLGTAAVTTVAVRFSLTTSHAPQGRFAAGHRRVWKGALVQAIAAEALSRRNRGGTPSKDFVAGLLQDIGCLALLRAYPEQYLPVLEEQDHSSLPPRQVERQRLGLSHVEVGLELCRRWGFAETLLEDMATHHQSPQELEFDSQGATRPLAVALATASTIAEYFCRSQKQAALAAVERWTRPYYELQGEALHGMLQGIEQRLREMAALLSLDVGEHMPYAGMVKQSNDELAAMARKTGCMASQWHEHALPADSTCSTF